MNAGLSVIRIGRWLLGAVISCSAFGTEVRLADMSGDYEDAGTTVAGETELAVWGASLHALLRLEFDPRLANLRREQTSHVTVKHGGGVLAIEVYDVDGEVSWRGRWRENEGYARRGEAAILRFRVGGSAKEEVMLILEPVASQGLLQVTAHRITPTVLGPGVKKLGTYLFHRVP